MPKKPKHPCAYPGCPNLTDNQYCPQHEKIARQQFDKYQRNPHVNKTYGRAWKRIRDRYASEHPLCEMCLKEGRVTLMEEVHHMTAVVCIGLTMYLKMKSMLSVPCSNRKKSMEKNCMRGRRNTKP